MELLAKVEVEKVLLVKLLSRLYSPTNGNISIDNYDIDKVELYSLRRQIGIVPQEPLLFSGTISENISLNQDDASNEDIIKAAKLASCHDFIMELPAGYNSQIGERGTYEWWTKTKNRYSKNLTIKA